MPYLSIDMNYRELLTDNYKNNRKQQLQRSEEIHEERIKNSWKREGRKQQKLVNLIK